MFLDEYLEFQSQVQEALREPIERGEIFISRKGEGVSFPAKFLLIAATNLCMCGSFIPGEAPSCSYSLRRCRSKLDKLSGPMLDRFDLLFLSNFWKGPLEAPIEKIEQKITKNIEFRKKRKQTKPNSKLTIDEMEKQISPFILKNLIPSHISSRRRYLALLKVGRTFADMDEREEIEPKDIEKAMQFCFKSFNDLKLLS